MVSRRFCTVCGVVALSGLILSACDKNARDVRMGISMSKEDKAMMEEDECERNAIMAELAVASYYRANKSNPPSLQALIPTYLSEMPRCKGRNLGYNPASGEVSLSGEIPSSFMGPSPEDQQQMKAIKEAINQYGNATGYYPPQLDALYPHYLPKPPRTADGRAFAYNNQNGEVTHPDSGT